MYMIIIVVLVLTSGEGLVDQLVSQHSGCTCGSTRGGACWPWPGRRPVCAHRLISSGAGTICVSLDHACLHMGQMK